MSVSVSHKLKSSLQGALAGGGDPATSPLYVFGPFLTLIVGGGVAAVTFGASIWLAVLTVAVVSAMYRHVMAWVVDGSGGSGLSEEELGGWAVKINAAITVIEYTLTFLVSIAALVTFIADRLPLLNTKLLFVNARTVVAVAFTLLVGVLVNRGPRVAARFFGPATAAVLLLLWVMIISVGVRRGVHLPHFDLEAFTGRYLHFTLAGYSRILALMTGIEIFANLVAAYEGTAREKSRKAFGSLLMVMGTTVSTMLIVGPAILELSDLSRHDVSVFTQTMDRLLPGPLAYLGSLVGIAVLLSAAAASAQGIQNLSLGLRNRHYIPATFGQRNRFDVPGLPVWVQVAVVVACFVLLGTQEETYLALYAAGVFILLSMTGWAATKRLLRLSRATRAAREIGALALTVPAALLSSVATLIIFEERLTEGAWMYFLMVPALYLCFGYFRKRLGKPDQVQDRLRLILEATPLMPRMVPEVVYNLQRILVPLDGTSAAEATLAPTMEFAQEYGSSVTLMHVLGKGTELREVEVDRYLSLVSSQLRHAGIEVTARSVRGDPAAEIVRFSTTESVDMIVLTTSGKSPTARLLGSSVPYKVIFETTPPLLLLRPTDDWKCRRSSFKKILVPLDGSPVPEQCLSFVKALAQRYGSELLLLAVPEEEGNVELKEILERYLSEVAGRLTSAGISVATRVSGSGPARTILEVATSEGFDLIAMTSHGRGGVDRQAYVKLGSAVDKVICEAPCPIFFVSAVAPESAETGAPPAGPGAQPGAR